MSDFDEQIKKHNQKWQKWIKDLQNEGQAGHAHHKQEQPAEGQNAYNYAVDLISKLGDQKQFSKGSKAVQKQFKNNECYQCNQIMLPPRKPIILFPCSHNICQFCIYQNGEVQQKTYKLKNDKCPKCKKKIDNHAINWNLMTLLCSFSGDKQLLKKQLQIKEQMQNQFDSESIHELRIRCDILKTQKFNLDKKLAKDNKSLSILEQALESMEKQKARNISDTEKLNKEKELIQNFLNEKIRELEKMEHKVQQTQQKRKIVMKTLMPLRRQIQKMKILQAAKGLQNN